MRTSVAIGLGILLAIASAIAVCAGSYLEQETESVKANTVEMSCKEVLQNPPNSNHVSLILTDFQHGKHYVESDYNGDGQWDSVCIPMFPGDLKRLGASYHGVIIQLANVKSEKEMLELFKTGQIPLHYRATAQSLDPAVYSRMAQKYPSMNFGKNVLLTSGDPGSFELGKILKLSGGIGFIAAILLGGIGAFMAMLNFLRSRIAKDDAKFEAKTNRAGLPVAKKKAQAQKAAPTTSSSNELQSERYLQNH